MVVCCWPIKQSPPHSPPHPAPPRWRLVHEITVFNDTHPRRKRKGFGVVIGVISGYYINICSYITGIVSSACVGHSALKACAQKQLGAFLQRPGALSSIKALLPGCPSSGTCWGIHVQHKGIIARTLTLCWSAAEWRELLTFYFNLLARVLLSKEATENTSDFCSFLCSTRIIRPFLCRCLFKSKAELGFHCNQWGPISYNEELNNGPTCRHKMTAPLFKRRALCMSRTWARWKLTGCQSLHTFQQFCNAMMTSRIHISASRSTRSPLIMSPHGMQTCRHKLICSIQQSPFTQWQIKPVLLA